MNSLWVFGYGSLMWEPGFAYQDRTLARLEGWHRSFCMRSIHHRGTSDHPGLVLALDAAEGACCNGVAYSVETERAAETLGYLRERELISSAYLETTLSIALRDGRAVEAVTYVIDPDHVQYCGGLGLEEQAGIIATARGGRGPNTEYLWNTAEHLHELGIADPDLDWLSERVRALTADASSNGL
ncbi:gamma-glutamylcyclotransferase [Defluviimonas sp. WL0024]|uniref:glutathione-specific gamma-glutamylcyclotransferase n=2 Tax=Albidovulum TaxID=205889 RepID=A0ABT3J5M3_9RHOB|nr:MULTISPECIES: gamma-glutamylcyclotransferase [Defluviimonas]MCU9849179.1 gamma-glutamylcyclotransferase [Defluviimonas sp. WL0024]MCW3782694.1 gamma-glutamylcyclotransferase [Defluviimonas salinarum]